MLKWVVRQEKWFVRCPLVIILFPVYWAPLLFREAYEGGIYTFHFWDFHWGLFWAMYEGAFVE